MESSDYLPKRFPNHVSLSAHFRQECNAKEAKPLLKLARNAANPARFLAETWQGLQLVSVVLRHKVVQRFLARLIGRTSVVMRLGGAGELFYPLVDGESGLSLAHGRQVRVRLGVARHEERAAIRRVL